MGLLALSAHTTFCFPGSSISDPLYIRTEFLLSPSTMSLRSSPSCEIVPWIITSSAQKLLLGLHSDRSLLADLGDHIVCQESNLVACKQVPYLLFYCSSQLLRYLNLPLSFFNSRLVNNLDKEAFLLSPFPPFLYSLMHLPSCTLLSMTLP